MIKLNRQFPFNYQLIKKDLSELRSPDTLLLYFENFIDRYQNLNDQYHFNQAFSKDFVEYQIDLICRNSLSELRLMPFGVKDVFNTKVLPTTMGSPLWQDFVAGNNARVVDELSDKGALIFSKLTSAEFAVHYFQDGKTLNPFNIKHITGTSSAGSAAAVCCGALPIALGTQTAGSIIRPSSFCGVYGFKPSFGAIDRTGALKTTDTLDTIGFISSDIQGIEDFFYHSMQKESNYFYAHKFFSFSKVEFDQIKVGVVSEQLDIFKNYASYVKDDFDNFLKELSKNISIVDINNISFLNSVHNNHSIIYNKSLSYYFKNEYKHVEQISNIMKSMIEFGDSITVEEYKKVIAQQPIDRINFDRIFETIDFIVTPSTATFAPTLGESEIPDTCLIWTYMGYPVISIPLFFDSDNNLPYGLQIVGPKFSDFKLLDFAKKIIKLFE